VIGDWCEGAQLRRSEIFIATVAGKAISSVRSDIEQQILQAKQTSKLDFAPTELTPFVCVTAIKIWLLRSRFSTGGRIELARLGLRANW